ncbi:MAG: aminotransferase [Candidatus Tectimicrobiota bacterium]|nr:MAG: aminotransferase [Candidatus Tectomicrobia bacterium]
MVQRSFLTRFARNHLETLNLRRFFGDYRTFAFSPDTFHLGIGEIANVVDAATWQAIWRDFWQDPRLVSRLTMYAGTRGECEANQALAEHLGELLGRPELGEQHVVPYDGGHNALNGVVRACVAPLGSPTEARQYVLVPTPCYPYFSTILNLHCGILAFTAYSAEELVQGIETLVNPQVGVVLINTPHNPTGYALTPAQVERINRAVAPYDCVLAVDMVYACNALEPQAVRALGGFDPQRTVYLDSFSKKFGLPGLRLGYAACANLELVEALRMMKAAESISASAVKLLFGAYLLRQHRELAEAIAAAIRRRHHAFRQAIAGIEEYGVALPPASGNAFYLPLFLERLLARSDLDADAFGTRCLERYGLEVVTGTRMYPPAGLPQGRLHLANGEARIVEPGPVVYAPDFARAKRPFIRVSFGIEERVVEAAARLRQACAEAFRGD